MSATKKVMEVAEVVEETEIGYISPCEMYAAVPYGKQFVILYNGFQIKTCRTLITAKNFINQERKKRK